MIAKKTKRTLILSVALAAGLLAAAPAPAEEGRIPIFEPFSLIGDVGGRYIVTRDIVVSGAARAVYLEGTGVEAVDLDLNGFRLTGSNVYPWPVIEIRNVRSVKVRNGFVSVAPGGADGVVIGDVDNGDVIVEDLSVDSAVKYGISLNGVHHFAIRRNHVGDAGWSGIHVLARAGYEAAGRVENNTVEGTGRSGIELRTNIGGFFKSLVVRDNEINQSAEYGIYLRSGDSALIVDNSVAGSSLAGIFLFESAGCRIAGNTVHGCGLGIQLSGSSLSLVADNVVSANTGNGIELVGVVSVHNSVERNVIMGNGGWGLAFLSNSNLNVFGRNAARGNTGSGVSCSTPGSPTCGSPSLCDEGTGNTSYGDNLLPGPPTC